MQSIQNTQDKQNMEKRCKIYRICRLIIAVNAWCVNLTYSLGIFIFVRKFCKETRCFLEKGFTRPPVVTVATNFKFLCNMQYAICSDVIKDGDNERGTGGRRKISNKAHIGSHTKVTAHRDGKLS